MTMEAQGRKYFNTLARGIDETIKSFPWKTWYGDSHVGAKICTAKYGNYIVAYSPRSYHNEIAERSGWNNHGIGACRADKLNCNTMVTHIEIPFGKLPQRSTN